MTLPTKLIVGSLGLVIFGPGAACGYELLRTKDIRYHLLRQQKIILDTEAEVQSSDAEKQDYKNWKEIIDKHKNSETEIKKFADWGESGIQEHEKINKLKNKCKSSMNTNEGHNNFQDSLEKSQKYCVKQTD